MSAATQLQGVTLDADRPNQLAVLLVKECVRARGDRLGHWPNHGRYRPVVTHDAPDLVLNGALLVGGEWPVHVVVEAEVVRGHKRTRLMRLRPDDVAQGAVEQMRAGVIAHRPRPSLGVDAGSHRLPHPQPAVERAAVNE